MSEKAKCPACESYTSAIHAARYEGEPCPYCGADLLTGEPRPTATSLTEFLLARLAEDEALARRVQAAAERYDGKSWIVVGPDNWVAEYDPARVLADVAAKRAIVEDFEILHRDYQVTHDPTTEARRFQARIAVARLALPYADHESYDESWRP